MTGEHLEGRWLLKPGLILKLDGAFLVVSGIFGLAADLASFWTGQGPFGATFFRDAGVIGVVEAHGLAVLTGVAAIAIGGSYPRYWHWHLAVTHALLGGANIAFFEVFERVGAVTGCIAVTAVHFVFVFLQAFVAVHVRRAD